MRGVMRPATPLAWAVFSAVCLGLISGCEPNSPLASAGVSLMPPAPWRSVAPKTWPVPGRPLAAWSGPGGASFVVYRSLPIPAGDESQLTEGLANRLANLPGVVVVARGGETVSGQRASRVEVVGPGTGDALAASGTGVPVARDGRPLVATRRVVLGIARPTDTLYLMWHAPESDNEALQAQVRSMLRGMRIDMPPARDSSY